MDTESLNFTELRDAEIVARMRKCNYEKFKTLVRMHLSFELDLNTDEFDLPCHEIVYEDKGKLKKWNRLSKKHKHGNVVAAALATGSAGCAAVVVGNKNGSGSGSNSNNSCNNGSPTESLSRHIDPGFLFHLEELKGFLMLDKNLQQEGIFRKTGSVSRQNELRAQIQNDKPLNLENSGYSAHDCATVFKGYLAELPEPLLTDAHYPAHLQIAPLCVGINAHIDDKFVISTQNTTTSTNNTDRIKKELHVLSSIQLLLLLLPDENRQLLQTIIEMLHAVAMKHSANKMSPDNLATLFAPHLICPRNLPPEALHYLAKKMASVIAYMIIRGQDIFSVPAKLATDIKAYFLERKRKKTMSPEVNLDESISDISTVNTVYTFVDREKTAAAHNTNTTDTELAQLYAHIQSLPESSKKRRLIKQFNKQNGQGTPLQLQAMNRIKNSETSRPAKSLGDSIKKHIFHKGIMSRTPKRHPVSVVLTETPNNSSMKRHKQRILFQSPNPHTLPTTSFPSTTSAAAITSNLANSHTPYNIKSHPLLKSISSSSLLINHQHGIISKPALSKLLLNEEQESSSSSVSNLNSQHSVTNLLQPNQSNSSSDGIVCKTKSLSAPVSRQTSEDLQSHINISTKSVYTASSSLSLDYWDGLPNNSKENSCITPLKLVSQVSKNLAASVVDKKSVAWDDTQPIDIEPNSHSSTFRKQKTSNDLKSRYKSEPNLSLSHIICDTPNSSNANVEGVYEMITPIAKHSSGRSLTRKLMKGVSMGNLKFPFNTPESTKRLVRTVSSTLMRRSSDDSQIYHQAEGNFAAAVKSGNVPLLHDMDENEIDYGSSEDEPSNDTESEADTDENDNDLDVSNENLKKQISLILAGNSGSSSSSTEMINCFAGGPAAYQQLLLQQSGIYSRNLNLVTSTPSLLLGRRSMSPITKSTQRMPKAMQESIMTPRSRKPVMVLATTTNSTDQNQTINPTDLSGYTEQVKHTDGNDDDVDEDNNESDSDEENNNNNNNENEIVADCSLHSRRCNSDNVTPHPEIINEDATSLSSFSDILKRRQLLQLNQSCVQQNSIAVKHNSDSHTNSKNVTNTDELSQNFREYLLTRSVLTAPPEDTSFTSHSDDFDSSHEIEELDENQLSSSLLYCLDGNRPETAINTDFDSTTTDTFDGSNDTIQTDEILNSDMVFNSSTHTRSSVNCTRSSLPQLQIKSTNRLANNPFVILNNARKRAATSDLEKISSTLFNSHAQTSTQASHISGLKTQRKTLNNDLTFKNNSNCELSTSIESLSNKENCEHNENFVVTKKIIISDYPGETLF